MKQYLSGIIGSSLAEVRGSSCAAVVGGKGNAHDVQAREDLARSLTAAVLAHTGRQEHSAIERIVQQLVRRRHPHKPLPLNTVHTHALILPCTRLSKLYLLIARCLLVVYHNQHLEA